MFRLAAEPLSAPVRYAELARVLGVSEGERVPLAQARAAVLTLRRGKGMVLDPADPDTRSAGSFFTNPVLDASQFAELRQRRRRGQASGDAVRVPALRRAATARSRSSGLADRAGGVRQGIPARAAPPASRPNTRWP